MEVPPAVMVAVLESRQLLSGTGDFWDTPEGQAFQASVSAAESTYEQQIADAAAADASSDQVALNNFTVSVDADNATEATSDQQAQNIFDNAVQAADGTELLSDQAAEQAYNAAENGAAQTAAADEQQALNTFNGIEQQAAADQAQDDLTASNTFDAAEDGATAAEAAADAAAGQVLMGVYGPANQTYQTESQAAYDAYYAAIASYYSSLPNGDNTPPPTAAVSFDAWTDGQYATDLASVAAAQASAYAAAESQYQSDVSGAWSTFNTGEASFETTYQAALAADQTAYDQDVASAEATFESAVQADALAESLAAAADWSTLQGIIAADQATYNNAVTGAEATYQAALVADASAYSTAAASAEAALQAALSSDAAQETTVDANAQAVYDAALAAANTAYDLVANDPNATSPDLTTAAGVWDSTMLNALATLLTSKASAAAAHVNADAQAEDTEAHTINSLAATEARADAAAYNAEQHALNAAAAQQEMADAQAAAAFLTALDNDVAQEADADVQAAETEADAIDAALAQEAEDDAQAATDLEQAIAPLMADFIKAVAQAENTFENATDFGPMDENLDVEQAKASAMDRWAAAMGTSDAVLAAALEHANLHYMSSVVPAEITATNAEHDAAAQWVNTVATAWGTYESSVIADEQTFVSTMIPAAQQALDATVADETMLFDTTVTLTLQEDTTKIQDAVTWVNTVAGDAQTLANTEVDDALTAFNDEVSELERCADSVDDDLATEKVAAEAASTTYITNVIDDIAIPGMPPGVGLMLMNAVFGADPNAPVLNGAILTPAEAQDLLDAMTRQKAPEPPLTRVSGVFGSSIYLGDSYFENNILGVPCVVCHGVTAQGIVGPPNTFRFPGGAAALEYYHGWQDTTVLGAILGTASSGIMTAGVVDLGIGTIAVMEYPLVAGAYPALLFNGTVYVGRMHNAAWSLAQECGVLESAVTEKYGMVNIDAAGRVLGWWP